MNAINARYRVGSKSPVNVWLTTPGEPDVQVGMCRTDRMASELVDAANGNLAKAATVVWSLFDDWERAVTDITAEQGYDPPDDEIENRRRSLVALFGERS